MPKKEAMEKRWFNLVLGDAAWQESEQVLVRVERDRSLNRRQCQRVIATLVFVLVHLTMVFLIVLVLSFENTESGSGDLLG